MAMDRCKVIDRIQKLEQVDGRSAAEAEAFMARAAALALEYQISRNEIDDNARVTRSLGRTDLDYFMGNASRGVLYLYNYVAEVFGCAVLGRVVDRLNPAVDRWQRCGHVVLLGTDEDRELVHTLVDTVLLPQMMRDVAAARPRSRMSYTIGWAESVGARLARQRDDAYAVAGAVIAVDDDLRGMVEELSGGRGRRTTVDGASVSSGGAAGGRADLGGAKVDASRGRAVLAGGSRR